MPFNYMESRGLDIWDEKFRRYTEGWQGESYSIVNDGMSGEYIVFGLRIAYSDDGFDFMELPLVIDEDQRGYLLDKFNEIFGFTDEELGEAKLLIFSHYS